LNSRFHRYAEFEKKERKDGNASQQRRIHGYCIGEFAASFSAVVLHIDRDFLDIYFMVHDLRIKHGGHKGPVEVISNDFSSSSLVSCSLLV
jgi:hypothetical protein